MTLTKTEQFDKVLFEYRWQEIRKHANYFPVLDVGCGDGVMVKRLMSGNLKKVIGIDFTEEVESLCKAYPTEFIYGKFEDIKIPNFKFKKIIASHVLEHVDDEYKFLNQCRYWLDDDEFAELIITVPNARAIHKHLGEIMGLSKPFELQPSDLAKGHKRNYSLETLKATLEASGFIVDVHRGIYFKPLPSELMITYFDQPMFDAFYELGKRSDLEPYCSSILVIARKK